MFLETYVRWFLYPGVRVNECIKMNIDYYEHCALMKES